MTERGVVVRAAKLERRFGAAAALDGLSLEVREGELFGLVGPDGAGKTTTLRILASILDPTAGEASVCGLDVVREAEAVKEVVGYMSQRFGLYADLTVAENAEFYADVYGVSSAERGPRLERLLGAAGLLPFGRRLAGNLSGGMKQKLGLVCALIHRPRVLLLDEPTNGVDPLSRRDFFRILYDLLREGVTVVLSTSYLDEAERCGRVALLDRGRVLACGAPDEVRSVLRATVLEVRTGSPRRAVAVLRARFGHAAVSLFGDRLHVVAPEGASVRAAAAEALASAGLELLEATVVAPSLEDVFVSALAPGGPDG